jgi:hypothetical protein
MFCVNAIAPFTLYTPALILMGLSFVFIWSGFFWARWTLISLFVVFGLSWLFLAPIYTIPKEEVLASGHFQSSYYVAGAYWGGGLLYLSLAIFLIFSELINDLIEKKKANKILPEDWKLFLEPVGEKSDIENSLLTKSRDVEQLHKSPEVIPPIEKRILSRYIYIIALVIGAVTALLATVLIILETGMLILIFQDLPNTADSLFGFIFLLLFGIYVVSLILFLLFLLPIFLYGCYFLVPFLLLLPVTIQVCFIWRQPLRFLLLRPFNRQRVTQSLKKIIRDSVSPYGHTYTLADADLKVPWYIRIPLFFGQISIFSHRLKKISLPHHIIRTIKAIRRKGLRTMNWCFSRSKVFPITCTSFSWQACVSCISQEMDIIIMDLSGIKEGVIWELEHCIRLGLIDRVIFFVSDSEKERTLARETLEKYIGNIPSKNILLTYGKPGLLTSEGSDILCDFIETVKRSVSKIPLKTLRKYRKYFWVNIGMEFLTAVVILLLMNLLWPIAITVKLPTIQPPKHSADIVTHIRSPDMVLLNYNREDIEKVTFSPNGKLIAAVTKSGKVEFWENQTARLCSYGIRKEYSIDRICFSPDGKYLITSGAFVHNLHPSWPDKITLSLWRMYPSTINLVKSVEFDLPRFEEIGYDNDGKLLIARSRTHLYLFDATLLSLISKSKANISDFSLSPYGSLLISAYSDKTIKIQKIKSQLIETEPLAVYAYDASRFVLSPDGTILASFSKPIRLRRIGEMKSVGILAPGSYKVDDICFSPNNRSLAFTTSHRTQVFSLTSKTRIELLHQERVHSICFDPSNPQKLIAGSVNGEILVWNLTHLRN